MSLREELEARLESLADRYAETEGAPTPDNLRRVYAEEMVRCMEYVRDQCGDQVGGAAEDSHDRIADMKLELPPAGWEPFSWKKK